MHPHPLAAWTLAGALSASLVVASGGLAGWAGTGSVALAFVGGGLSWAVAGWLSLPRRSPRDRRAAGVLGAIWGIAGIFALLLAVRLGALAETLQFGDRMSQGWTGMVVGIGAGGALGGWMTATIAARRRSLGRRLFGALTGALVCLAMFTLGGYLATVTGIVVSELWKDLLGQVLGRYTPVVVGWGIGGAVGGFVGGLGVWLSGLAGREGDSRQGW